MTAYTANVPNSVSRITVTPTADSNVTVGTTPTDAEASTDDHEVDLSVGANTITVTATVTAEDGTTLSTTYTVTVNRAPATASNDATLSDLSLAGGATSVDLVPVFASDKISYTASVASSVTSVTVTANTAHTGATFDILDADGNLITDADAVTPGYQVDLRFGANTIRVKVTAEDHIETETYAVTVTRELPPFTATFDLIPATHDGSSNFSVQIQFSDAFGTFNHLVAGVQLTGGTRVIQSRVGSGGTLWSYTVRPDGDGDVTITLPAATICNSNADICSGDDRPLAQTLTETVSGPALTPTVTLVVTPATITEADDPDTTGDQHVAVVTATVTITAVDNTVDAADKTVTVTVTGTVSSAGVTAPDDVTLTITDDDVAVTFTVTLSNASGAPISATASSATGTIEDDDRPGAPQNLVAGPGDTEVTLSWDAAGEGASAISRYEYRYKTDGADPAT